MTSRTLLVLLLIPPWAACRPASDEADGLPLCTSATAEGTAAARVARLIVPGGPPSVALALYAPAFVPEPLFVGAGTVPDGAGGRPPAPSDRYLAGSVGKTFFAATALKLAEQGLLDIDDSIAPMLPAVPNGERITLRMLLGHRSGFPEYDLDFLLDLRDEPTRVRTLADWIGPIERSGAVALPGSTYRYSDLNYVILAAVLEAISDEPYPDLIERLFTRPLGLEQTVPALGPGIERLVPGRDAAQGLFGRDVTRNGLLVYNPQFESGGGGYASNPVDLAKWLSALANGRVLSPRSYRLMTTPGPDSDYGLGMHVFTDHRLAGVGHSGFIPGYLSWVKTYEVLPLTLAMQINSSDPAEVAFDGFDVLDDVVLALREACTWPRDGAQ